MIPSNFYLTLMTSHIVEIEVSFLIDLKHVSGEEADELIDQFVDLHDKRPQVCVFLLNKAEKR